MLLWVQALVSWQKYPHQVVPKKKDWSCVMLRLSHNAVCHQGLRINSSLKFHACCRWYCYWPLCATGQVAPGGLGQRRRQWWAKPTGLDWMTQY